MFQMHAVGAANRTFYEAHLDAHYRIRHDIYVGERGWLDLARPDGREIDAFDSADTIYLLGIMPGRGVVAGSRLVPSLKPHLMSEVFPELAGGRVPRGPHIFEWTRYFVVPALRKSGRSSKAAGIVQCGILEFCLQRQIRHLTIVCEPYWHDRFASLGWNPRRLGNAVERYGEPLIGIIVDVSPSALSIVRDTYGISEPVLWMGKIAGDGTFVTPTPSSRPRQLQPPS